MCAHQGLGRVVLTSRRVPAGLDGRVRVVPVDALSLDEALLLARELPHLRSLIVGDLPGVEPGMARSLALHVLNIAQGHPKLLELANGQAADPGRLRTTVAAAGEAWRETGGLPEGFFTTRQPPATGEDYVHVLGAWTHAVATGLVPGHRDLFWFLCCLEEDDRIRSLAKGKWPDLWARLGRDGAPPALDAGQAALTTQALIAVQPGTDGTFESYGIHPSVAAAGRSQAGTGFQEAVDNELAALWTGVSQQAQEREGWKPTGRAVVRAGLSATPYLLRLDRWQEAGNLLEQVLVRDRSRATAEAVLPALQAIAAASAGTAGENASVGVLARALGMIDQAAAARHTRATLAAALASQDYETASAETGNLITSCLAEGRLDEALALAKDLTSYVRQADLGPWTQLLTELRRLQVLGAMGQAERVLAETRRLLAQVDDIPTTPGKPEFAVAWDVHEALLTTGRDAALHLGRWQDVLDLNATLAASMRGRGASDADTAETLFNNYGPLLHLGRTDAALTLLLECREVFESAHDINAIGAVLTALAHVESQRGHGTVAIGLARDSLRYMYLGSKVTDIAKAHHNLGTHYCYARQQEAGLGHYVAAAMIRAITGSRGPEDSIRLAADYLRTLNDADPLPADLAELYRRTAEVPGVDLDQLLTKLSPDRHAVQQTLEELTNRIRALASTQPAPGAPYMMAWEPIIAAMLAAKAGDTQADAELNAQLANCERSEDLSAVARALRRLSAGESGPELLDGLDNTHAVIVNRAQDALAGRITIPAALWAAMPLRWLLVFLVGAAIGADNAAPAARQLLDALAADPQRTALARALSRILHGDRNPSLATSELNDPTERAIVATVLYHIGTHNAEQM